MGVSMVMQAVGPAPLRVASSWSASSRWLEQTTAESKDQEQHADLQHQPAGHGWQVIWFRNVNQANRVRGDMQHHWCPQDVSAALEEIGHRKRCCQRDQRTEQGNHERVL